MNRRILRPISQIAVVMALAVMAGTALAQGYLPGSPQPSLTVNVAAGRHAISPDIYGVDDNGTNNNLWGSGVTALPITFQNWGGDATETYNWAIDEYNSGDDYWFVASKNATPTPGAQVDTWVTFETGRGISGKSGVTVPIIGMVDGNNLEQWCAYPQALYPSQEAFFSTAKDTATNSNCGDGLTPGGALIQDTNPGLQNPPSDPPNYIPESPTTMTAWFQHLYGKYGEAFPGGNVGSGLIYVMDNEPEYWRDLNTPIHYNTAGWAELANGPLGYGAAAKAVDPTAQVMGPVISSVWPLWDPDVTGDDGVYEGYGCGSTLFGSCSNPQAATCTVNGVSGIACPFYEYYLTSAANYQEQTGVRPLDYFDIHYYPDAVGNNWSLGGPQCPNLAQDCQLNSPPSGEMWGIPPADGVYYPASAASGALIQPYEAEGDLSADGGVGGEAGRLRSTRALWDPTYYTEDWEGYYFSGSYGIPMIIRRMKSWTSQYYPGTKTAITEYNWGGGTSRTSFSNNLAQADVFGIFGREGLDLAAMWSPPTATQAPEPIFKMFLNYNGTTNGTGHFGDVSVQSTSTVTANSILPGTNSTDGEYVLSIYGAQRTLDNALTMVVVNKSVVLSQYPYSISAAVAETAPLTIQNFTPSSNTVTVYQTLSTTATTLTSSASATLTEVPGVGGALPTYTMNYTFPVNSVTLLVVPGATAQAQAIGFAAASPVTYGVAPITLSATGGASGNPVVFSLDPSSTPGSASLSGTNNSILTITGAGTVVVDANQAGTAGALSYTAATQVSQSIVVNKAALTVTANNTSMAVGAALPAFTASYSGFVNEDSSSVVNGSPSFATTATSSSPAGLYPITPSLGTLTAANYTFTTFVPGTLSIVQAPTVIITTSAVVTGSNSLGYTATITVKNTGTGAASNVSLNTATLGSTSGSTLPQSVASIGPGGSTVFSVTFPGSAGLNGAGVKETYSGTYTGGSFSASVRSVTLP